MCNCQNDLETSRKHTAAHVMTKAVKMLFPDVKLGVGPATETGFYQDFDFGDAEISDKDFKKIEKKMRWLVNKNFKIQKSVISEKEAREVFADDPYKNELIDDVVARGEDITFYDFVDDEGNFIYQDVCAGPHLESTGELGVFKIEKLAGAYWRGDEKNKMLTRIYGVAFATKEELEEYEKFIEEARKRDHRVLGKELDLYTINPKVGLGLPLWKPKGAMILSTLRRWFENEQLKRDYQPVYTPHIGRKNLWETSGHWGFYNDSMYPPIQLGQNLADFQDKREMKESEVYLLKPMNCPFHMEIYNDNLHSYRDLPLKLYEFGTVYRYEKTGELGGLTRVRGFTQDDAHLICTSEQLEEEMKKLIDFAFYVLEETFGLKIKIFASFRDPKSDKYLGKSEDWDFAEETIRKILKSKNLEFEEELGEAAFYGPKIDLKVCDAIGREWQLSTVQFDFNLPERFDMAFINKEGEKERPFVIHRALLGSLERFMGILIEHFEGAFPAWLAPVQLAILPISDKHLDFAYETLKKIKAAGGRAEVLEPSDTLNKRIRKAQTQKLPFAVIVGDEEMESGNLTVRKYGEKKDSKISLEDLIAKLEK